jgi:hypothetical protein
MSTSMSTDKTNYIGNRVFVNVHRPVKNSFERVSVCATARTTYVSQQQHTHTQVRRSIEVAALKLLLIWLVVEFRWFRDAALTQDASNVRHHPYKARNSNMRNKHSLRNTKLIPPKKLDTYNRLVGHHTTLSRCYLRGCCTPCAQHCRQWLHAAETVQKVIKVPRVISNCQSVRLLLFYLLVLLARLPESARVMERETEARKASWLDTHWARLLSDSLLSTQ